MANNILEMALELLEHEQKFLPSTLSAWFGDATVVSFTDNRLVLHSPSDFKQKYITDKFIEPLQNAVSADRRGSDRCGGDRGIQHPRPVGVSVR